MRYLIQNVKIYDGLGNKPFLGDVVVEGEKIQSVSPHADYAHTIGDVIDGTGLSLAPGFVDVHTHSDAQVEKDPGRPGRLLQGITSEIGGQCGSTRAPFSDDMSEETKKYLATVNGFPKWRYTFEELLTDLGALPLGAHQKYFVGHRNLHCCVAGIEQRPVTDKELDRMCGLCEEAMQAGALGLSTGLTYIPGPYTDTKELIALAKVAAKYGGMYTSHMRNESDKMLESVKEVLEIGRQAGLPVNISHIKTMYPDNWSKTEQALELVDKAIAEGLDVTMDAYPYDACSTTILSTVPPSVNSLGIDAIVRMIEDPAGKAHLKDLVMGGGEDYENPMMSIGPGKILVVGAKNTKDAIGKFISEYGEANGLDGFDAWCKLIHDNEGAVTDVRFAMRNEDIGKFYSHPKCMVGSDGLYSGGVGLCHPRYFGTMTRYLARFVRDGGVLPMEEGIRRITSMACERYGLKNKGVIRAGYDADLVLFDENKLMDHADYLNPFAPNEGIRMVFVMGGIAAVDNVVTGLANGKLYRR